MPRTRRGVHISAIFAIGLLLLAIFLRPTMEQFRQRKAVTELERISANRYQWDWAPSSPGWLFNRFNETRKHWGDWVIGASDHQFSFDTQELDLLRRIPHLRRLSIGQVGGSFAFLTIPGRTRTRPAVSADVAVDRFPQLESLTIFGFHTGGLLLTIRNCQKLTQINLQSIYSADVEISGLPALQELTLGNINQDRRVKLSDLANLRCISVSGGSGFINDGVFTLRDLPGLETIRLNGSPIRAFDLSALPKLRQLSINYSKLDDEAIASLGGLQQLQSLQFSHFELSDAGLAKLHNLPALETLEFRGTSVTTAGLASLGRFSRLRELTVDWSMSPSELEELRRALPGVIIDSPFRLKNKVAPAVTITLQKN